MALRYATPYFMQLQHCMCSSARSEIDSMCNAVIGGQRMQCSYRCTCSSPLIVHSVRTDGYVFCGTLVL